MNAIQQKYWVLFFIILFSTFAKAQVLIVPSFQNSELFFFDHLFQVNLINSTNQSIQGVLEIDVENRNQERVVKVSSPLIMLQAGALLNSAQLPWNSSIEFGQNQLIASFSETGRFPYGSYIFCYRFIAVDGTTLGVNCQEKAVNVTGQPELISPYDKEIIRTPMPLLTWKPPLPLVSTNITYHLRLCHMEAGQSIAEALRINYPLIERRSVREPFMVYPTDALPLEEGESYVWQIRAFYDGLELGETEIWQFTYQLPNSKRETEEVVESYRLVKNKLDGVPYIATDILHFAYDNRRSEAVLNYKIYPQNNVKNSVKNLPRITLKSGLNKIDIEGAKLNRLEADQRYVLKIKDENGSNYYFNFIYYETNED